QCRWWPLVDSYGAISLHIGVSPYGHDAGAGSSYIPSQQEQVYDVLYVLSAALVLGDAHAEACNDGGRFQVHLCCLLELSLAQSGGSNDGFPRGRFNISTQGFESCCVTLDEIDVQHTGLVASHRGIVG